MKKDKFYTIDDYIITKEGQIINSHNNHIRKPQPNSKGYLRVQIGGKNLFVHKLVAEKYIPNLYNKPQINHIDGNKNNNAIDNLEWVDNQENRDHAIENFLHLQGEDAPTAKLNWEKVDFIRNNIKVYSQQQFAKMYNVSPRTISDVINFKTWKHKPSN